MMIRLLAILLLFSSSVFAGQPKYLTLKSQFRSFVEKAKNADFETQLQLWQNEVESVIPKVYSDLLSQRTGVTLEQNRRERASKWFPFMIANSDKILAQFETFEKSGWPMAQQLAANYPQIDFSNVKVIAMPSLMMFNGQVRLVNGEPVALFGMDFLQLVDDNPKLIDGAYLINNMSVMVAHEFTHVLYDKVLEVTHSDLSEIGLLGPLWNEGLAQMHSQMLVVGTDYSTILMEHNLAEKCTSDQVSIWAKIYLQDTLATSDSDLNANYSKWFTMNDWKKLGVARAGYCLGYHAVLFALREHSFNELLYMTPNEVSAVTIKALNSMASSN
jgi:hypothetical protein